MHIYEYISDGPNCRLLHPDVQLYIVEIMLLRPKFYIIINELPQTRARIDRIVLVMLVPLAQAKGRGTIPVINPSTTVRGRIFEPM
jgi:hypothetical protein